MLSSTLYADKETQLTMDQQDDRFCLKLSQLYNYDFSVVGQRKVFEKLLELIEKIYMMKQQQMNYMKG